MSTLSASQLKHHRDHATKAERIEYEKQRLLDAVQKMMDVWEIAWAEQITPIKNKYMSHHCKRYIELDRIIAEYQKKTNILLEKYHALCQA